MPDWITVSGVITNVATAIDLSYRYAPTERIVGKDAGNILKEAKTILSDAMVVLEDHKEFLPPHQYEKFKTQYRIFNWNITDESQENRAVKDAIIKQSRILSQLYANRDSHQKRAYALLCNVESYQADVLAASRKAAPTEMLFPDELTSSASDQGSAQSNSTSSTFTSWFSVFGQDTSNPSPDLESGSASPSPSVSRSQSLKTLTEASDLSVTLTYFPEAGSESIDLGSGDFNGSNLGQLYRRVTTFENENRRIDVVDRELHTGDPRNTPIAEDSMREMTQLGKRLMAECDLSTLKGPQLTSSTSDSSMESTVQKFGQMSAGS